MFRYFTTKHKNKFSKLIRQINTEQRYYQSLIYVTLDADKIGLNERVAALSTLRTAQEIE